MTPLDEYQDRFESVRFERHDGILQMTLHSAGESLMWGHAPHDELGEAFRLVGDDFHNQVVIVTGTGDAFIDECDFPGDGNIPAAGWARTARYGRALTLSVLDVAVPMIAAVNGPARTHSEIAVLCDIVLACTTATFSDARHFPLGIVPGDTVQTTWLGLLGPNRGRHFLLTGRELSATEALDLGVVAEVLEPDRLLPRAWELARRLRLAPTRTRRYTRQLLTRGIRAQIEREAELGFALEGLAAMENWPSGRFSGPADPP